MKPKIKILYECSFDGDQVDIDEFEDRVVEAAKVALKNPGAKTATIEVDDLSWGGPDPVGFFVIYKKLDGVKRVTNRDIVRAIQDRHEGQ